MRNLLMALMVVGLLAAPSLGQINIKLTAAGPIVDGKVQLNNGATTTVYLWGQASSGLYSLGGDINAGVSDPALLTSNPSSIVFSPDFSPTQLFTPKPGTPGSNGGWSAFGSLQTDWEYLNTTLGVPPNWALFCQYTVTAAPTGMGDVILTFAGRPVSGFKPLETNKGTLIGSNIPLTIEVGVPEPATLALLTLGGLLAARRRK